MHVKEIYYSGILKHVCWKLLSNQISELEHHTMESVEVIINVAMVARGNIQQASFNPQTEQHLPFGLMLLHLGNGTITYI